MKLPKNFGGQGYGGMLKQAQDAMARARDLEDELARDRIPIDKGDIKAVFDGTGQLIKLSINPSIVDKDDVELLEDLITSCVRDGFHTATELRNAKVNQILPDVPGL